MQATRKIDELRLYRVYRFEGSSSLLSQRKQEQRFYLLGVIIAGIFRIPIVLAVLIGALLMVFSDV